MDVEDLSTDVNMSHILDTRLKQIEDENRVYQLRQDFANSKSTQTDDEPKKVCWFPFTLFRKFQWY